MVLGRVDRYEAANVRALNFVMQGALGGGGPRSLRADSLGKTLGRRTRAHGDRRPRARGRQTPPPPRRRLGRRHHPKSPNSLDREYAQRPERPNMIGP